MNRLSRAALRILRAAVWGPVLGVAAMWCGSPAAAADDLAGELRQVPHKIVYETWQPDNWELFMVDADGSNPVNLTRTPKLSELFPHVSPDGTKVCFSCDEGEEAAKVRSLYLMNIDGTERKLLARNARDACWNGDGTAIAFLGSEVPEFSYMDYATKGIFIYDLATGKIAEHPKKDTHHLYNLCWSPDGKWFVATVHAGMGFSHAILAIPVDGTKVIDLKMPGCRPDLSPDGKKIAWGRGDFELSVGDFDTSGPEPKVTNRRDIAISAKPNKIYHVDWSPDGKYVAFSRGPTEKRLGLLCELPGVQAEGWNICVADPTQLNRWVEITKDGNSNKEPDWVPVKK